MGPVRRGLTRAPANFPKFACPASLSRLARVANLARFAALVSLSPTGAFAEVCDKERPSWDGTQVTVWSEPYYLYTTWLGWVLLLSIPLAILLRRRWAYGLCAVLHGLTVLILVLDSGSPDPTGIRDFAVQEGCVGPAHLSIAICACILGIMTTLTLFNPTLKRSTQNE